MLYEKMGKIYKMINLVRGQLPAWEEIIDLSIINSLSDMANDPLQVAEGKVTYQKPTVKVAKSKAISSKPVSISFATGSATLTENAKTIIDYKFGDIVLMSSNRIRIEGNTDSTGSYNLNVSLSEKRAKAVADYLITKYNVDRNRIITVGNGPDKPIADNNTDTGRAKNRRTDFQLLGS
jgi:NitT/TauT family transport system substrate-binding protein